MTQNVLGVAAIVVGLGLGVLLFGDNSENLILTPEPLLNPGGGDKDESDQPDDRRLLNEGRRLSIDDAIDQQLAMS